MISAGTPVSPQVSRSAVSSGVSPPSGHPLGKPPDVAVEVTGWLSQQDAPCGIQDNSTVRGLLAAQAHPFWVITNARKPRNTVLPTFPYITL
jgi:hypothetical protein